MLAWARREAHPWLDLAKAGPASEPDGRIVVVLDLHVVESEVHRIVGIGQLPPNAEFLPGAAGLVAFRKNPFATKFFDRENVDVDRPTSAPAVWRVSMPPPRACRMVYRPPT